MLYFPNTVRQYMVEIIPNFKNRRTSLNQLLLAQVLDAQMAKMREGVHEVERDWVNAG